MLRVFFFALFIIKQKIDSKKRTFVKTDWSQRKSCTKNFNCLKKVESCDRCEFKFNEYNENVICTNKEHFCSEYCFMRKNGATHASLVEREEDWLSFTGLK